MKRMLLASIMFTAAACGGGKSYDKGMVNSTQARAAIDQVGLVSASMSAMNGSDAADAVMSMTAASQGIVAPAAPGRLQGLIPDFSTKTGGILSAVSGTAECTATSCTFDNYGDATAGWLINGTISNSGGTYSFDLSYDITSFGSTLKWNIDGSLTVTATSIDGQINSSGESSFEGEGGAGSATIDWDVSVDYRDVVLDPNGCPTGGSVYATTSYEVSSSQGGSGSYAVEGTATFGPACGQVQ
ncbi:MAG: hypothetical protein AB7P03_04660 [Kofleriaceae bacterium]